jgi:hypothetical protein
MSSDYYVTPTTKYVQIGRSLTPRIAAAQRSCTDGRNITDTACDVRCTM